MRRRAYLDRSIGEARAVVTLDGLPERLVIEREDDIACQQLGARSVARVAAVDRALGLVFVTMAAGPDGTAPLGPGDRPVEGATHAVRIAAEAQNGKGPVVQLEGEADGPPRLLEPAPALEARLAAWADGPIQQGAEAREAADEAQAAALAVVHPLPRGGSLAIEPTRALTAIDVDVGGRPGTNAARTRDEVNLAAIASAARLLRLKGLGGLVAIDLAGRGHNGARLLAAAREAFAPDNPGVAFGPISRFGVFELSLPRRQAPAHERLCDADGSISPRSAGFMLLRDVEREARANPGARLAVRCRPSVALALGPWLPRLTDRIGARLDLETDAALGRTAGSVTCR